MGAHFSPAIFCIIFLKISRSAQNVPHRNLCHPLGRSFSNISRQESEFPEWSRTFPIGIGISSKRSRSDRPRNFPLDRGIWQGTRQNAPEVENFARRDRRRRSALGNSGPVERNWMDGRESGDYRRGRGIFNRYRLRPPPPSAALLDGYLKRCNERTAVA